MKRILLLSLFLFIFASTAYATGDGLVAYYSFDEGNGAILRDRSGNGNDGAIYGAAWTSGINGSALGFDGVGDYVQIPSSTSLKPQKLSIELWVKPDTNLDSSVNVPGVPILTKTNGQRGGVADGYEIQYESGKLYFGLAKTYNLRINLAVERTIPAGEWSQIIETYDGQTMKLYLNGQLIDSMPESLNIYYGSDNIWIGKFYMWGRNHFFNGTIDEVKIYNRALSPEEIKQEYEKYTKPAGPLDSDGDGLPDKNETAYQLNPYSNDTDSDGINDSAEYSLLSQYLPTFQYTEETSTTEFYPQPVSVFLDNSTLYRYQSLWNRSSPISEEELAGYGDRYFLDFNGEEQYGRQPDRYKQAYDKLYPKYGYAIYMRAVPSSYNGADYVVLQYWHHYLYNEFINKHEGDWEMVEIILSNATFEPIYAAYSQHEDMYFINGGEIKKWADVEKNGAHPLVYVARGSHASYFEAKNHTVLKWVKFLGDYASSLGLMIGSPMFNKTIIISDNNTNLSTQGWLEYGGKWGMWWTQIRTNIPGFDGPQGPKYQGDKWNSSAYWGLKYLTRETIKEYAVARLEGGALAVIDKIGRQIAIINSTLVNDIPKADVISIIGPYVYVLPRQIGGSNKMMISSTAVQLPQEAAYTYTIEPNGTYSFELYLANETEAKHIVFYNVSGTSGTLDNVWVEGNRIYMNTTDGIKRLNAMLEYMTDAGVISTNLTGISFEGDETLVIDVKDWTKINETGAVAVEAARNKCRLKDGCTKVISHSNDITGLLLRILGPGQIELTHWNNRSGKIITK